MSVSPARTGPQSSSHRRAASSSALKCRMARSKSKWIIGRSLRQPVTRMSATAIGSRARWTMHRPGGWWLGTAASSARMTTWHAEWLHRSFTTWKTMPSRFSIASRMYRLLTGSARRYHGFLQRALWAATATGSSAQMIP